jgi:hypothetical protein
LVANKERKERTSIMEHSLAVMTFSGWETYQQDLVESIAPLSPRSRLVGIWVCTQSSMRIV